MKGNHHMPEQIVRKLREADRMRGEDVSLVEVDNQRKDTEQTGLLRA